MNLGLKWAGASLAVLTAGCAMADGMAAPVEKPDVALLRECIADETRKLDFSGVVSVAQSGSLTTYAQGVLAGPGSASITPETQFNIGSAGKMFTSVAVAQLVDGGKIRLDDPIGRTVQGLTAEASGVTIRQLLTHSSGLGNYFAPENLPALRKARSLKDLLPLVAADKPQFLPGSRFSYSDTGFLLLGLMIERVSGQSYGDYLQSHIFGPAQMTNTALDPAPARAVGMTAMPSPQEGLVMRSAEASPTKGSAAGAGEPLLLRPASGPLRGALRVAEEAALHGSSAGGSFSTASDMQKFFAALMQGKLTSVATMKMLVSSQIVAAQAQGAQPEHDYGLGFGVGHFNGHRWWGHNGGAPGVNVEATVFPDDQLSIVVLANNDPPAATMLFHQLRTALLDPAKRQMCGLPPQ